MDAPRNISFSGHGNSGLQVGDNYGTITVSPAGPVAQPSSAVQPRKGPVYILPFSRNAQFVGRQDKLDEVERKINVENQHQRVAIEGLGGVGKTQMALEYAYKFKDAHPECSIFWVYAGSAYEFEKSFIEVGKELQIPGIGSPETDSKNLVKAWLNRESSGPWLMILDNADDFAVLYDKADDAAAPLADYLPQYAHGSILMTSRDRKASVKFARNNIVSLQKMDPQESQKLLREGLIEEDSNEDDDNVAELSSLLDHLPLAIVQATAYINENDISIAKYLELYNESEDAKIELLSKDFEDLFRYSDMKNPIMTTWLISFELICKRDPLAIYVLHCMACLDNRRIPISLIPAESSDVNYTTALGTLKAFSFITPCIEPDLFDMHSLVQLATRARLRKNGELNNWTNETVEYLCEVFPNGALENKHLWEKYLPHAFVLLEAARALTTCDEDLQRLLFNMSSCLESSGDYTKAELAIRECLKRREKMVEPNKISITNAVKQLGDVLNHLGKYKAAEEAYDRCIESYHEHLGQEHLRTRSAMNDLAFTYILQCRWEEAETLLQEILNSEGTSSNNTFGLDKFMAKSSLALVYKNQGRIQEAVTLESELLSQSEAEFGTDHPDTLRIKNNLASTYSQLGMYEEAVGLSENVVELNIKVLGEDHPQTLSAMRNHGNNLMKLDKKIRATEIWTLVYNRSLRVLGEYHPETLDSMANMVEIYGDLGKYSEQEDTALRLLEARKMVLTIEHSDTLWSMIQLARIYRNQGRLTEAEELGLQAVEGYRKVLGVDHIATLYSIADLAITYFEERRFGETAELEVQILENRKETLGLEHRETLIAMANLALTYWQLEDLPRAEQLHLEAIRLSVKVLGADHSDTKMRINQLVINYREQGRPQEAEDLLLRYATES